MQVMGECAKLAAARRGEFGHAGSLAHGVIVR
jgi:hypothetical protein